MFDRREMLKGTIVAAPWWLAGSRLARAEDAPAADLIVHGRVPHNAEPPLDQLAAAWITPVERFYVRSHAPVPEIDVEQFRLSVDGLVDRPLSVSLGELQRDYGRHATIATLTCAGNRRSEHSRVKPVGGVPWQAGAIGNAEWAGARLSELLAKAGLKPQARHVWFEGLDEIERDGGTIPFGASIPLDKALADTGTAPGALVAYEMNGRPLSPDHGFPLRTVVPGYIGARSVKWLGRIIVSDRPSTNHYVAKAYKLVTDGTDDEWSAATPIGPFPINAVTCIPAAGAMLTAGRATVRGYALAAGLPGRTVARVELSADGGTTWTAARFASRAQPFCWRLWTAELPLTAATSELLVRATDSAGQRQPPTVAWNLKGYLFNAWHRTPVRVR